MLLRQFVGYKPTRNVSRAPSTVNRKTMKLLSPPPPELFLLQPSLVRHERAQSSRYLSRTIKLL